MEIFDLILCRMCGNIDLVKQSKEMKIYTARDIVNAYELGTAYKNPDGTVKLSEITTKPQGSNSNYISIGKFIAKQDDFGDRVTEWHHYGYPKETSGFIPGFKCKSEYEGKGAQTKINWTFIVPADFLKEGWAIAVVGTGQGGKGNRKTDIEVVLDAERPIIE